MKNRLLIAVLGSVMSLFLVVGGLQAFGANQPPKPDDPKFYGDPDPVDPATLPYNGQEDVPGIPMSEHTQGKRVTFGEYTVQLPEDAGIVGFTFVSCWLSDEQSGQPCSPGRLTNVTNSKGDMLRINASGEVVEVSGQNFLPQLPVKSGVSR